MSRRFICGSVNGRKRALAERLAGVFLKAAAPLHHAQAYAALRTAVEQRSATVELIEHLRTYFVSPPDDRPFVPPDPI